MYSMAWSTFALWFILKVLIYDDDMYEDFLALESNPPVVNNSVAKIIAFLHISLKLLSYIAC